jgi:hypothetical protein
VSDNQPMSDIVEEGLDVVRAAAAQALVLRLFGGVGIRVRSPAEHSALERWHNDLDFVAPKGSSNRVSAFFSARGYSENPELNALHGHYRLWFYDEAHLRHADVFVGKFEMCHAIPVAHRLELEPVTLPAADLLLTKLQIVELTDKDRCDLLRLLLDHDVGAGDPRAIDGHYVARLCGRDWGLWRTCTTNLEHLAASVPTYGLPASEQATVGARLDLLGELISRQPKSVTWRARAIVGERMQWYELPEEPDR